MLQELVHDDDPSPYTFLMLIQYVCPGTTVTAKFSDAAVVYLNATLIASVEYALPPVPPFTFIA